MSGPRLDRFAERRTLLYPFATPGARLRVAVAEGLTFSAVAFNGNPALSGPGDPQVRNSSATNFLIGKGGFLMMGELAYQFDRQPSSPDPMSDINWAAGTIPRIFLIFAATPWGIPWPTRPAQASPPHTREILGFI